MYIAKELFDECFCPCDGIARVCLRGDMINPGVNFPKELVDEMEKKDGEWYTPSCYSVDIMSESGFDTGAALHYTTNNGDYICLGVVDNSEELKEYYLKTASEEDIKETGWKLMSHSIGIMEVFNIGLREQKVTTDNRLGEIRKNTFGTEMKIIAYRKNSDIDIQFLDDNGYVYEHQTYSNFKTGQIKNPYDRTIFGVGYIGVGKYKTGLRKRNPEQYVWRGMLERCYGDKYKDVHSAYYNKCYVCDEWLNFQVFAEWYNENIYQIGTERMHLDKDILIKGNKVYSPDTCLIVPQSINEIFHVSGKKTKDIDLPYTILRTSKEKYSVSFRGKSLGIYDTVDKALDAYLKAKKDYIRQKVEEMENELPIKVRDALLAW